MLCERFLVCVVLISACATGTLASESGDESLKEFEERIDRLRHSLDDGVGESNGDDDDDDDFPNEASGESSIQPDEKEEQSYSATNAESSCCETGEIMAAMGFDCSKTNLLLMTRRQKIRILGTIFQDLGISITDKTRSTLYTPFRLCLLKDTSSFMKCCLVTMRLNKGRHSNKDIGSRVQSDLVSRRINKGRHSNKDIGSRVRGDRFVGFNRRFGASLNRFDNRGPCRHGRCPVGQSRNMDRRRHRHGSPFRG